MDEWVVTMPKLGETVTEGEITNWFKAAGDAIAFDDPLFEVSTDKVDSEIPSPYDGVLLEILVASGETVPVGTPLVRIGPPGSTPGQQAPHAGVDVPAAATPATAAAGGTSLSNAANPTMGGSEGGAGEPPGFGAPVGEVHDITMPKLGETVTEGTIGSWLKAVGDPVAFDDALFEVSTDKVDSEIPSPYDGVLLEILVPAGETVPVGTPLARIGEPGAQAAPVPVAAVAAATNGSAVLFAAPAAAGGPPAPADAGRMLSPLVRRLLAEAGLDASAVRGTGVGGRIRREDVARAVAGQGPASQGSTPAAAVPGPAAGPAAVGPGAAAATSAVPAAAPGPSAATSATAAAARPSAGGPAATGAGAAEPGAASAVGAPGDVATRPASAPRATAAARPAGTADPRDEVVGLSKMRLAVAGGMKASQTLAASVWTSVEVDFHHVEQVRAQHKARFKAETGSSLSYLPFISRAVVDALRAYPTVNSSIDVEAKTMTLHPYVNLGIAVDLDQQGLVVPVLKDADGLNMRGIARGITAMAAAARNKKLAMDDMQGSTFTITNPGPFASWASAPIINQPNTGILCTDGVKRRPVAVGDMIAIHPTGIIGLVYDHRAFDGSTASLFLMHIRDSLEQRDWAAEVG